MTPTPLLDQGIELDPVHMSHEVLCYQARGTISRGHEIASVTIHVLAVWSPTDSLIQCRTPIPALDGHRRCQEVSDALHGGDQHVYQRCHDRCAGRVINPQPHSGIAVDELA